MCKKTNSVPSMKKRETDIQAWEKVVKNSAISSMLFCYFKTGAAPRTHDFGIWIIS